jgi:subtilisin family serine protease
MRHSPGSPLAWLGRKCSSATTLSLLSLLAVLSGCRDSLAPGIPQQPPSEGVSLTIVAQLNCVATVRSATAVCETARSSGSGGPRLGLIGNGEVKLRSANVSWDSVTELFRADINVQNLLAESIGTRDGTTRTGIRVFHHLGPTVTSYLVPGDTAKVTVFNPDGTRNFTAPNQPYFQYDTILAPTDSSRSKLWLWKVPRTVNTFSFTLLVEADLPSEAAVPGSPPDSVPAWVYAAANTIDGRPFITGQVSKDVVVVKFKPFTSQPRRRAAIDSIAGTIIGGRRQVTGDGFYYVHVAGDGTAGPVIQAARKLRTLAQVSYAGAEFTDTRFLLSNVLPLDGPLFSRWRVRPLQADSANWGPEAVAAPLAWGCSRGDTAAAIAVVDYDFHSAGDLVANQHPTLGSPHFDTFNHFVDTGDHGTSVAAILAAAGDNLTGITGMMFNAHLRMYDLAVDDSGHVQRDPLNDNPLLLHLNSRVINAGMDGATVINLSYGIDWDRLVHPGYDPSTEADTLIYNANVETTRTLAASLQDALLTLESQPTPRRPLLVLAAGNNHLDAIWAGYPLLRSTTYGRRILVVAAAARTGPGAYALASFSNHTSVDVVAPGADVYSLSALGDATPVPVSGTSFAAPFVSGIAGLIVSFDPRAPVDSIRSYILRGAQLGNVPVGSLRMVNAYWSLRRAAARRGAPLCGNPVFQDSLGRVYARRDTVSLSTRTRHETNSYSRARILPRM